MKYVQVCCSNCPLNDGMCYTSLPPKYKCTATEEFHDGYYQCGCVTFAYVPREKQCENDPAVTDVPLLNYDGNSGTPYTISHSSVCNNNTIIATITNNQGETNGD